MGGVFRNDAGTFGNLQLPQQSGRNIFLAKLAQPTGMDEISGSDNDFFLYPNPANNMLYVRGMENSGSAMIFDQLGRNVLTIPHFKQGIDVRQFPSGIYYITISNEQTSVTKKLIIHH